MSSYQQYSGYSPPFHENLSFGSPNSLSPHCNQHYQQSYHSFHPPTPAQFPSQHINSTLSQPCSLPSQSQNFNNTDTELGSVKEMLLQFQRRMLDIERENEYNMQQEEPAFQAHIRQQELEA